MSTSLYWRPLNAQGELIGYELKHALAERLWSQDGSLSTDWIEIGREELPFLEGIAAAHQHAPADTSHARMRDQAGTLADLIRVNGAVEVSLR